MDYSRIFYDGTDGIVRILLAAPIMYLAIILFIRLAGKRSTSQMNNFDWIVTVALGSITGSGIILKSVTVSEALLATAILLATQWLLTSGILRFDWMAHLVKAEPRLLVHRGQYVHSAMRAERVTETEVMSAIRARGLTDVRDAQWVILETDATFSVIADDGRNFSNVNLEQVSGFPPKGAPD
jgi:uncharacterized membrane protein YcaP (DUF421 family)